MWFQIFKDSKVAISDYKINGCMIVSVPKADRRSSDLENIISVIVDNKK